jgi:predicted nuclease of predicted toxin-antitoxin system
VLFLLDEDVVVGVGRLLASNHDVEYIRDVFGSGTKDPEVVRYAMPTSRVLVTADRPLGNRLRLLGPRFWMEIASDYYTVAR